MIFMIFNFLVLLHSVKTLLILDDPRAPDYQFQEYTSYVTYMASNADNSYEDSLTYNQLSIEQDQIYSDIYGQSYSNTPTKAQEQRINEIREQLQNLTANWYKCKLKGLDVIQAGYVTTEQYTYKEDSTLLEFIGREDVLVDYYLIGTAYQPYGATPCYVDEASDAVYEMFWNQTGASFQQEYDEYQQKIYENRSSSSSGKRLTNSSSQARRLLQSFSSQGQMTFQDQEKSLNQNNVSSFWKDVPHLNQSAITIPISNLKLNSYYNVGVNITWKQNNSFISYQLLYFNTITERKITLINISKILNVTPKINRVYTKWMNKNNRLTIEGDEVESLYDPVNLEFYLNDSSYDNVDRVYLIVMRTAMYYDDPIWYLRTAENITYKFCTFQGNSSFCPWDNQDSDTEGNPNLQDSTDAIVEGSYIDYSALTYESVKLGNYIEYFEVNTQNRTGSYKMSMPFLYSGQNFFQVGLYVHFANGTECRGYDWFFVEGPTFPYVEPLISSFAYGNGTSQSTETSSPDYGCGENDRCDGRGTCLRTQMTCKCHSGYGGLRCQLKSDVARLKQQYLQQKIDRLEQKAPESDTFKSQLLNLSNSDNLNSSQALQLQNLIQSIIEYIDSAVEADAFLHALQQLSRIQRQHFMQDYYIEQPDIITKIGKRLLSLITSGSVESAQDDFTTKTSLLTNNISTITFLYPLVMNGRTYEMPTLTIPANTGASGITLTLLNPFMVQRILQDPISPVLTINLLDSDGNNIGLDGSNKIVITLCPLKNQNLSLIDGVWWNTETQKLDSQGCQKAKTQESYDCLTFECDHLTMFTLRSQTKSGDDQAVVEKSDQANQSEANQGVKFVVGVLLVILWI